MKKNNDIEKTSEPSRLKKIRTIDKAIKEIKELDPNTAISPFIIRQLANQEKITTIKSGNKIMVDVESIIMYFEGTYFEPKTMII